MLDRKDILSKNANIQLLFEIKFLSYFAHIEIDERGGKISNIDVIIGGSGGTVL